MPEEEQKKEDDMSVILKTDMHCQACQEKVSKIIRSFPGVEEIDLDARERQVTVKGRVDAKSIFEAVKKKCSKRTVLVHPQLPDKEEEETKEDGKNKTKDESLPDVTIELQVKMHCAACAKEIKKILLKVNGVTEVNEDQASDKVVVKGRGLSPHQLCEKVRRSGKQCQIIMPPSPPPQKEDKKEEEMKAEAKEGGGEKKDDKREEKQEESLDDLKFEVKKYVYYPHQTLHYIYAPQLFSDENPNACVVM